MPEKKSFTKYIGIPIEKGKEPRFTDDGFPIAKGFFTSDNKDAMGDIITKDATERAIDAYRQWGNIRYMHQPKPVGKVIGIGKADGLKWNEVEFKIVDKDTQFEVDQGLLSALSVGIVIQWDDIELMEDGGFQINDYSLAEISLVDHPANYDAVLKGADASEGLRTLIREYGFGSVAEGMAALLDKEMEGIMPEEVNTELEATEEEIVEETTEEPEVVEEQKDIEEETTEPAAEEANDVEMEKDLEEETEEESEEESTDETPEETVTDEVVVMEAGMVELMKELTTGFSRFAAAFEAHNEKLDRVLESLEAPAEDQGTDQSESEEVEDEVEPEVEAEEVEVEEEKSAPVDREGAIPETDLEDITAPEDAEIEKPKNLRDALGKYLAGRTTIFQ